MLEGALKAQIAKSFKGRLTLGTIRREVVTEIDDDTGDDVAPTVTTFSFEGIRESFSARYKAQSGIKAEDVKILVLLGSCVPATTPVQGDKIYLEAPWNKWHHVREVMEIDPAGATASLMAYEVPAP